MANTDKMVDKVKKLLALAGNNPSEEEAKAALRKAQEIIAQYNLNESELNGDGDKIEYAIVVCDDFYRDTYRHPLASAIARAFRGKPAMVGSDNAFIGRKQDAQAACEAFKFAAKVCLKQARKAEREARAVYGTARGVFPSYTRGFVKGVERHLDEGCKALMIVVPEDVNSYYDSVVNKNKHYHSHSTFTYKDAYYHQGEKDGYDAMKARTIEGGC